METLSVILTSLLSLITLVASTLLIRGLFPTRVAAYRQTMEQHWKRSFWIGLLNTVLITVLVTGLGALSKNAPLLYVPTFALYGVLLIILLFGLSAFADLLGERLYPELGPVQRTVRGGTVFLLSSLLPAVGWFLLFPYGISLSVGAVVITLFQNRARKRAEKAQES